MPLGDEVTVPAPVPALVTFSAWVVVAKVAVTFRSAVMVTVQAPVPLQAPPQPVKVDPAGGVAARPTVAPAAKLALHVEPQSIPAGVEEIVPAPVLVTAS